MKRLLFSTLLLFLGLVTLSAQNNFEGTIRFKMDFEGDENMEMMKSFLPENYTLSFLENDLLFQVDGLAATMMGDILYKNVSREAYMIKRAQKLAYRMDEATLTEVEKESEKEALSIQKLEDKKEISGYWCQLYKVNGTVGGINIDQDLWVSNKIRVNKDGAPALSGGMGMTSVFNEEIDGFPLMIVSKMTMPMTGSFTLTLTADEVNSDKPDVKLFEIPEDFKVEKFDPSSFQGSFQGK